MRQGQHTGKLRLSAALSLLFFTLALLCLLGYRLIGSSVDEQGWLHEPFALIPLGWLCLLIGLIAALVALLHRKRSPEGY